MSNVIDVWSVLDDHLIQARVVLSDSVPGTSEAFHVAFIDFALLAHHKVVRLAHTVQVLGDYVRCVAIGSPERTLTETVLRSLGSKHLVA